jgi:hypothetical protein
MTERSKKGKGLSESKKAASEEAKALSEATKGLSEEPKGLSEDTKGALFGCFEGKFLFLERKAGEVVVDGWWFMERGLLCAETFWCCIIKNGWLFLRGL